MLAHGRWRGGVRFWCQLVLHFFAEWCATAQKQLVATRIKTLSIFAVLHFGAQTCNMEKLD